MPVGDPTEPLPESAMRYLRPAGLGLAALLIGFNGAALLLVVLHVLGGPQWIGHAGPLGITLAVPVFMWLTRRSRRKRAQWAEEAAAGKPPRVASIAACGALVAMMGGGMLVASLRERPLDVNFVWMSALIFLAGWRAVATAVQRRREALVSRRR